MTDEGVVEAVTRGEDRDYYHGIMIECYEAMVDQAHPQFRLFFQEILAHRGRPLLFHCSAGKDRTGLAALLLLSALGVDPEEIRADFLRSNAFTETRIRYFLDYFNNQYGIEIDETTISPLLTVDETYLDAAHRRMEQQCGSVRGFLREALGLTEADQRILAGLYLEED